MRKRAVRVNDLAKWRGIPAMHRVPRVKHGDRFGSAVLSTQTYLACLPLPAPRTPVVCRLPSTARPRSMCSMLDIVMPRALYPVSCTLYPVPGDKGSLAVHEYTRHPRPNSPVVCMCMCCGVVLECCTGRTIVHVSRRMSFLVQSSKKIKSSIKSIAWRLKILMGGDVCTSDPHWRPAASGASSVDYTE